MMFFENATDAIIDYGIMLPMRLTYESPNRTVRLLGMFVALFWFLPASALCFVPLVLSIFGTLVENVWKGGREI